MPNRGKTPSHWANFQFFGSPTHGLAGIALRVLDNIRTMRSLNPLNKFSEPFWSSPIRLLAVLAATLLAFTTLAMNPLAAQAAPNNAIKVSGDLEMKNGSAGPATVEDKLTFEGTWDASDADPQPGDTFTITLPEEFEFNGDKALELKGEDDDVWGTC